MAKRVSKIDPRQGWLKLPINGGNSSDSRCETAVVGQRVSKTQIIENIMKKPLYSDYTKKQQA